MTLLSLQNTLRSDHFSLYSCWIPQSLVRRRYAAFTGMLEEASRDNLEFLKEKALKAIAQLLLVKPEQEARLLTALVNKLGDPSRKLASKVDPLL